MDQERSAMSDRTPPPPLFQFRSVQSSDRVMMAVAADVRC